jgi:hypothetical protein
LANVILGLAYTAAGRLDDARKIVASLEANPTPFGAFGLANLHTALGNGDEAIKWLNFEPHHAFLPWARVSPDLASLRPLPEFARLLERMKLPPKK